MEQLSQVVFQFSTDPDLKAVVPWMADNEQWNSFLIHFAKNQTVDLLIKARDIEGNSAQKLLTLDAGKGASSKG